ncbi:dTDP-glucose 4,6-dehydratase [Patescibacteria group bacterium]|nr:dTDP-glucose 4,6-dehydratase [Patescibacteria group bacterium]MBU1015603.1 dTDP-glucose 4,6-dehydratase [Patescibacteria group bacterium]MBU1685010.1 dTDP-glucose 4,6-dehydratase [Patescibacteria group bacterium]MBU1938116.1 dTDP-glucose 4,6-dehydratase [Patescibacteria group bacterium]
MKLLVTGGAGFIGSHFIRHLLAKYPDYQIINLDKLTYAGNLKNCEDYANSPNYRFVQGDIADKKLVDELAAEANVIVNIAAETHVDNSIEGPAVFLETNVMGTQNLLEAAKNHAHGRFVQVSTDEVYGDRLDGSFTEIDMLSPSSPYSASKAAGDLLCLAYKRTYGTPVLISRCSNNYGTHQYPEKLIPFFIKKLLAGEKVPLYGDGSNVRDWLHVTDHCKAIDLILHKGKIGKTYNVSSNEEHSNLEITKRLLELLNLPEDRIEFVKDRPGHDLRYSVDASKIKSELGWVPEVKFEDGFAEMVEWYKNNQK